MRAADPIVSVCPVRESLDLPCVVLRLPEAWSRGKRVVAEVLLTHRQRRKLIEALQAAERVDVASTQGV